MEHRTVRYYHLVASVWKEDSLGVLSDRLVLSRFCIMTDIILIVKQSS
jgi:hypothetical protein